MTEDQGEPEPRRFADDLHDAVREFGRALLASPPGRAVVWCADRLAEWLAR